MMNVQEKTISVCGLKLALRVFGDEKDPPLLALHGWLDNAGTFDLLAPLLKKRRIFALDFPGHGFSDHKSSHTAYHFVDWIHLIFEVAHVFKWKSFDLMGHSMGGGVASLVAGTSSVPITKLILIEGLGSLTYPPDQIPHRVSKYIKERLHKNKEHTFYRDRLVAIKKLSKNMGISQKSSEILAKRGLSKSEQGYFFHADKKLRLTSPLPFSEEHILAFLSRIEVPTLLIRGENGFVYDLDKVRKRVSAIKNLHQINVSGGHHIHLETPDKISSFIQTFLELSYIY